MPNITIVISTEEKTYLESLGHNVTGVAQRLLDDHLNRTVNERFKSSFTKEEKLTELNKK